jgi:hypothetical protein
MGAGDIEIRKKIVASYGQHTVMEDGLCLTEPGWTWIVEPEGYAVCVTKEDLNNLVGKTLKVIEVWDEELVMEICD